MKKRAAKINKELPGPLVLVRVAHIREAQICMSGSREFFARHGLSWAEFLENGLPAEALEATGDGMALRVTAIAREESSNGRK